MTKIRKICLLGFGEVGEVLAKDLAAASTIKLAAYDLQFHNPQSQPYISIRSNPQVDMAASASDAVAHCDLVISAVTAAQSLVAAQSVCASLSPGTFFLDLNSVAPTTKISVAQVVETCGGRYVEAAVLSPIMPKRMNAPILIGGPHAQDFLPAGINLGFSDMRFCSAHIGPAAATKMCRSIMIKGVESLLTESLLTARHYGVEDAVMASLHDLIPWQDWPARARYMISRSLLHGMRRAEEMREAADTVCDAGIRPHMSSGCVATQAWLSQFDAALKEQELVSMLDGINTARARAREGEGESEIEQEVQHDH
ncbi:MAG: NAD(P)-dependent oxidoreductase [Gammaproteobacteria bacterium]|nr:NAD(P)-dependent oxidoreductase [Gammaproteobacteria bacterium]